MLVFSKPLLIIPLVIFFLGISLIPMADSVLRPEIRQDVILTEKEKEEKFQRCLGYIPSDATVAERTAAEDVCEHILTKFFTGSRAWNSIIDDHITFIKNCIGFHDTFLAAGEINVLKITKSPMMRMCIKLYKQPIWEIEDENRMLLMHKWYNENMQTGKEILAERDREIKWELISSSNEDLEKLKTTQMDTKPSSPEKEIEVEPKQEAIPEKDDRFDFKPEKQQDVVVEEDDKFCFLFWCW